MAAPTNTVRREAFRQRSRAPPDLWSPGIMILEMLDSIERAFEVKAMPSHRTKRARETSRATPQKTTRQNAQKSNQKRTLEPQQTKRPDKAKNQTSKKSQKDPGAPTKTQTSPRKTTQKPGEPQRHGTQPHGTSRAPKRQATEKRKPAQKIKQEP